MQSGPLTSLHHQLQQLSIELEARETATTAALSNLQLAVADRDALRDDAAVKAGIIRQLQGEVEQAR